MPARGASGRARRRQVPDEQLSLFAAFDAEPADAGGHGDVLRVTGGAGSGSGRTWPEDAGLLEDLVEQVIDLAATWKPTTEWHMMSVVRTGRTVEWLVWQVATAADDELGPMYREDPVIPFAIDLETLPRYPLLPTLLVHPDDID